MVQTWRVYKTKAEDQQHSLEELNSGIQKTDIFIMSSPLATWFLRAFKDWNNEKPSMVTKDLQ